MVPLRTPRSTLLKCVGLVARNKKCSLLLSSWDGGLGWDVDVWLRMHTHLTLSYIHLRCVCNMCLNIKTTHDLPGISKKSHLVLISKSTQNANPCQHGWSFPKCRHPLLSSPPSYISLFHMFRYSYNFSISYYFTIISGCFLASDL